MVTPLYQYKGRKFVLLCGCNSNWTDDRRKWGVQGLQYDESLFHEGPQIAVNDIRLPVCEVCHLYPWIVLPKGEVFNR